MNNPEALEISRYQRLYPHHLRRWLGYITTFLGCGWSPKPYVASESGWASNTAAAVTLNDD